jgi:hypothetical protein
VSTMSNSVSMALALAPPMMMPLFMFGGFFVNTRLVDISHTYSSNIICLKLASISLPFINEM